MFFMIYLPVGDENDVPEGTDTTDYQRPFGKVRDPDSQKRLFDGFRLTRRRHDLIDHV
jgi:hypothetical protein